MRPFKFFSEPSRLLYGFENRMVLFNPQQTIVDCEFCFQFNDDEPVVFASGNNTCSINISPTTNGNVTFNNNNNTFKIFARERQ